MKKIRSIERPLLDTSLLIIFYIIIQFYLLISSGFITDSIGTTLSIIANDIILICLGSILLITVWSTIKNKALIYSSLIASIHIIISTQALFFIETGVYYSSDLAIHTISNIYDTWKVISETTQNNSLTFFIPITSILILAYSLLKPENSNTHKIKTIIIGSALLSSAIIASSSANNKSPSLFSSLHKYSHANQISKNLDNYKYNAPTLINKKDNANNKDIVIYIIESARAKSVPGFSADHNHADMPFVNKLRKSGTTYKRTYTTTSHTSKALIGILCGVHPSLKMEIVESSPKGLDNITCLPKLLNKAGYKSLYIQTATKKFENRPQLINNMGFDNALYKEEIKKDFKESGYFGLDEMAAINPAKEWWEEYKNHPRILVFLTSISHHPYELPTGEPKKTDLENYHDTLSYTDKALKDLTIALGLEKTGKDTILIITGDHGESFGEHGPLQHDAVPYEEAIHVPLILKHNNNARKNTSDLEIRQHIDILPSILEILEIEYTGALPGISLKNPSGHNEVYTNCWYTHWCSARIGKREKWIYKFRSNDLSSYRIDIDKSEEKNIAPKYKATKHEEVIKSIIQRRHSINSVHSRERNKNEH